LFTLRLSSYGFQEYRTICKQNSYWCSLEKEKPINESWFPINVLLTENDSSDTTSTFSISLKWLVSSSFVNDGTTGADAKFQF